MLQNSINSSQRKKLVKNFRVELLVVTSLYKYLILGLWAELLSALRANSNSTQRPKKLIIVPGYLIHSFGRIFTPAHFSELLRPRAPPFQKIKRNPLN